VGADAKVLLQKYSAVAADCVWASYLGFTVLMFFFNFPMRN
jgi:hypothetical protein